MVYIDNEIENKIRKFFTDNPYGEYTASRIHALFVDDECTLSDFIAFLDKLTRVKEEQKILKLSVCGNAHYKRKFQSIIKINLTKPFLKKRIGKTCTRGNTCWLYSLNL